VPQLGLPGDRKPRWCAGCAKAHAGAVNVSPKHCEGCSLKEPNYGLPAEGKRRWCSGCAKAHVGAVDVVSKKCEGCGLKTANYGLLSEGKRRRWCLGCAPKVALASGRRKQAGEDLLWANKPKAADPPLTIPGL
jgi:hypothetical protein